MQQVDAYFKIGHNIKKISLNFPCDSIRSRFWYDLIPFFSLAPVSEIVEAPKDASAQAPKDASTQATACKVVEVPEDPSTQAPEDEPSNVFKVMDTHSELLQFHSDLNAIGILAFNVSWNKFWVMQRN